MNLICRTLSPCSQFSILCLFISLYILETGIGKKKLCMVNFWASLIVLILCLFYIHFLLSYSSCGFVFGQSVVLYGRYPENSKLQARRPHQGSTQPASFLSSPVIGLSSDRKQHVNISVLWNVLYVSCVKAMQRYKQQCMKQSSVWVVCICRSKP